MRGSCYDEFFITTVIVYYSDDAALARARTKADAFCCQLDLLTDHDSSFYTDIDAIVEQLIMEGS